MDVLHDDCDNERRSLLGVEDVQIHELREENHGQNLLVSDCSVQEAFLGTGVLDHFGPILEQKQDHLHVPILGGEEERGAALGVGLVDPGLQFRGECLSGFVFVLNFESLQRVLEHVVLVLIADFVQNRALLFGPLDCFDRVRQFLQVVLEVLDLPRKNGDQETLLIIFLHYTI